MGKETDIKAALYFHMKLNTNKCCLLVLTLC